MPAALLPLLSRLLTTLIGQVFIALGISAISYKGVEHMQAYFVRAIQDEMGRMPSEALQLFYIRVHIHRNDQDRQRIKKQITITNRGKHD